jgi:hypothetical protein
MPADVFRFYWLGKRLRLKKSTRAETRGIIFSFKPHFGNQTISKNIILRFTILRLPHRCGVAIYRLRFRLIRVNQPSILLSAIFAGKKLATN